jgi:hypothetical protein
VSTLSACSLHRLAPRQSGGITLLLGAVTSDVDHAAVLRLLHRCKAQPLHHQLILQLFTHPPPTNSSL